MSTMASQEEPYRYPRSNRPCSFEPFLYTERLTLTLWDLECPEDTDFAVKFHHDPALISNLGRPLFHTAEQIRAYRMSTMLLPQHTPYEQPVSGPSIWFIRLKTPTDNTTPLSPPIGMINITSRVLTLPPDIGWGLLQGHHGKGYASEAAIRVRDYILDTFQGGFRHATPRPCGLVATLNEKNTASARVAAKIGLVRLGEVLYERSEERVPVYGVPGLGTKPFVPDPNARVNVFGCGEGLKRTLMALYGQEELPENPYTPVEQVEEEREVLAKVS